MELRLREILDERNITLVKLAQMSGMSQPNLSNYINGKTSPTVDSLSKIANALDIDITELFKKKEEVVFTLKVGEESIDLQPSDIQEFMNWLHERRAKD